MKRTTGEYMSAQASAREIVTVGEKAVERIEFNGIPVVTLSQIDKVHARPEGTARRNFNHNKKHIEEGKDYTSYEIRPKHANWALLLLAA